MKRKVDYGPIANVFDRRYAISDYSGVERALFTFVGGDRKSRALEIGCGTGHWLRALDGYARDVAGIDPFLEMLMRAQEAARGARLVCGRAEQLPWRDGSFDRVFCVNAFHHFSDRWRAVVEARRVLRSDGGLMIIGLDPHTALDRWWIYDLFPGTLERDRDRYPPAEAIRRAMAEAGFDRCTTREVQHSPVRVHARQALERGLLDKNATSQLVLLSEREYRDGMARLRREIDRMSAAGEELVLEADLRLWATAGWV